ncbi:MULTISPECIES: mechanosensitive ion channel family protein [Paraburkholderia]|uniref:mechanosensitive ion channel family protein n=1 Tax=Paraburkholderia TaxID=1822464 RepID=UPI0022577AC9|nr:MULTISPECIES: mechanosensitive ion channel domain-containing protein [Paraburkholderia]MCX4139774.1 mechanosensitive ion channel [Paraburkholderia aspalathi]MCX4154736.1 mechanosensitive ion channel [Paraburkholderia aspalathi]MDN7164148.1 mechanosensitive ion channel [Paraburkholderia sp. SECH2]MDN7172461.1 mechanosensitive ion channel [Paraburkholderia sp. SEWSISQ10-3 4]MDQ6392633.1 mechanosensitive ion channel [Paraburkholderia aspalathi]
MRKKLQAWLVIFLLLSASPVFAAAAQPAASAASGVAPTLTPEQARQALSVLNDPTRRAQVSDTLQAIAAAGALSAPPASTAAAASAPAAASSASALVPAAFKSNGLASQLARQGAHWAVHLGKSLRSSVAALLDLASVRAWWHWQSTSPQARGVLGQVAWSLLAALLPALALEWLARRLLRRAYMALAARRERGDEDGALQADLPVDVQPQPADAPNAAPPLPVSPASPDATAQAAKPGAAIATPTPTTGKATDAKGEQKAVHHLTLLQRLPRALLTMVLRLLPLAVFVGAASALMSIVTEDGTPQDRALDSLIDIYVLCRLIVIVSGFFLQPSAPRLRLLRMSDAWAAFVQRWIVRIVAVVGAGSAIAEIAQSLGLNDAAHLALMKVVALAGHIMISILILKCRKPVGELIRRRFAASESLEMFGNALADAWAGFAAFVVMALWSIWALDVQNGYRTLLHLGGITLAILVGARVVAIVIFGAMARLFNVQGDAEKSLVQQHAYRYYPLLRRVVAWLIGIVTALALLQVWGVDVGELFRAGSIGHRLASALVTIGVAAVIALVVWEGANVSIERRLDRWTTSGDLVRAARLRTLLPMLRSALFCVIALVVVLTGLSELGVNIGPLLAGASIFGVALGFGSQKLVQDFITGMFLLMENAMQVGDWVTLAGVSGTVEYLSIRTVRLRGSDGSLFTVPFSSVTTVNNTNRGLGNAAVKVNIVFGEDVDLAIATLKEIGAALREDEKFKDGILSDFSFWGVDGVDGSAVTLAGQIQCRDTARWGVQREFNRRILDQFSARGIEIANPQRHLLTWDPESVPAKVESNGAPDVGPNAAAKSEPPSTAPADASLKAAAGKADAPVEDQVPVDPKPAGGPGTPANPGSASPHE